MNIGFEKMKLSEIAKLLEDNKILKFVTDNNDSTEKPIKIKMKDSIIHYYDTGENKYSPLEIPLVDFQLFYFKPAKTVKEKLTNIFNTVNFNEEYNIVLHDIDTNELILDSDLGKEGILFYENSYQLRVFTNRYNSEEFSHSYPIGFLDSIHKIFKENNYSFID